MASNYPSSLPVKDAAGANLSSNPHSALHDDMYDDIVAIATELGTLPKGTAASVKARLDALPRGVIDYAAMTTGQGSITTTPTLITELQLTVTAVAGRLYRTTANLGAAVTNSTSAGAVSLYSDPTYYQIRRFVGDDLAQVVYQPMVLTYLWTGSGSVTHGVIANVTEGAGTLSVDDDGVIMIEDIGAA